MLPFRPSSGGPLRVLGLAAHPDDLEIGCGGTVLTLLDQHPDAVVTWMVLTSDPRRAGEARAAADAFLAGAGSSELVVEALTDGMLPDHWRAAKEAVAAVARRCTPDLVLAPRLHDAHQDHRLLGEVAWQVCRGATIWHYEIVKWEGDLGSPSLYVPLDEATVRRKLELLHACFPSQAGRGWFDDETFRGLLRLRGVECGARYAEAFDAPKTVVAFA